MKGSVGKVPEVLLNRRFEMRRIDLNDPNLAIERGRRGGVREDKLKR